MKYVPDPKKVDNVENTGAKTELLQVDEGSCKACQLTCSLQCIPAHVPTTNGHQQRCNGHLLTSFMPASSSAWCCKHQACAGNICPPSQPCCMWQLKASTKNQSPSSRNVCGYPGITCAAPYAIAKLSVATMNSTQKICLAGSKEGHHQSDALIHAADVQQLQENHTCNLLQATKSSRQHLDVCGCSGHMTKSFLIEQGLIRTI